VGGGIRAGGRVRVFSRTQIVGGDGVSRPDQPHLQLDAEVRRAAGQQLLGIDPEPLGEVPNRLLGRPSAARFHNGDERRRIPVAREILLGKAVLLAKSEQTITNSFWYVLLRAKARPAASVRGPTPSFPPITDV
jgi:hypothetical protein